jgi:hypothetical protein
MQLSDKAIGRASEVFLRAQLNDARLQVRAAALAEALAERPNLSLPRVWSTPAILEAGYHFLRNPRSEFTALMRAVQQATHEAALKQRTVLVVHDTTDISCPAAEPEEVGFLNTGKAGFFVHHALCVCEDASRTPLGIVWSDAWARPQRTQGRSRNASGPELAKLKERESDRWLESVTEAQLWTDGVEQVIHVMDTEADSYRLFDHLQELKADFVVRLRHNRRLDDGDLAAELAQSALKLRRTVALSARKTKSTPNLQHQARTAREVELSVRCATVEIQPPHHMRSAAEPIMLNVVQVLEERPTQGDEPVAWVIATNLPIQTRAQIERVIDIYRARWVVEEFHKALKTGCMFEKRQLESFESITTLLALCYPIACELLRVRSRARQAGIPASEVLRATLLDCLRAHPQAQLLADNPTAEQALAVIAGLGGHIKHNGPPGWQTLAAGYMQLLVFEKGWLAALAATKI